MTEELVFSIDPDSFSRYKDLAGLNEKQIRLFFGWVASSLGRGGIKRTSKCFGVGINTVRSGLAEFGGEEQLPDKTRIRRAGAGRKATEEAQPGLREAVQKALEGSSCGDPEPILSRSTLSLRDIQQFVAVQGFKASHVTIGRLIGELGYSKRLNSKIPQSDGNSSDNEEHFRLVESEVQRFLTAGLSVIALDCRGQELADILKNRAGIFRMAQDTGADFSYDAVSQALATTTSPFGLHLISDTVGFMKLTERSDSGELALESIRAWWQLYGKAHFPDARELLIVREDCHNDNSRDQWVKELLALFSGEMGLEITVRVLPTGTTKWNKVGHRLFCYISRTREEKPLIEVPAVLTFISDKQAEG